MVIYLVLAPPFESIEREGALERHSIISDKKDWNFVAYQVLIRFTSTRAPQILESWNAGLENRKFGEHENKKNMEKMENANQMS